MFRISARRTPSSGLPATFSPCQGEKGLRENPGGHGDECFTAMNAAAMNAAAMNAAAMNAAAMNAAAADKLTMLFCR